MILFLDDLSPAARFTLEHPHLSVGQLSNAKNMDFPLALAGLRDVVGSLHPHEGVHFYSEGFFFCSERSFNAQRHVSGEVSPAIN